MIDPGRFLEQAESTGKGIVLSIKLYAYPGAGKDLRMVFSTPGAAHRSNSVEDAEAYAVLLVKAMIDEVS
jgi:hypothetical protein